MNRQRSTPEFNDKDVVHELHALDRETLARLLFHGLVELKKIVPVVLSQPALERDEQNPKRKHALLDRSLMVVPLAIKRFNVLDDVGGRCHATSHCELALQTQGLKAKSLSKDFGPYRSSGKCHGLGQALAFGSSPRSHSNGSVSRASCC